MAIKKRSINSQGNYTDYQHYVSNFNNSGPNNPTHNTNLPTNFNLKTITLEDCDRSVYEEFNKRFKIGEKFMPVIILDAEVSSLHAQNFEQFDKEKGFLNGPFFTMFRTKSTPKYRTNPAYKKVVYTVPKQKANGIVYEDYITECPLSWDLTYEFKFITNYREYSNQMEQQMRHYFRNKRNIIVVNEERFSIGPKNQEDLVNLEMINRENVEQKTMYVLTFELILDCFTRDLSTMQKRERPNTFLLDMTISDSASSTSSKTTFERNEIKPSSYPTKPI